MFESFSHDVVSLKMIEYVDTFFDPCNPPGLNCFYCFKANGSVDKKVNTVAFQSTSSCKLSLIRLVQDFVGHLEKEEMTYNTILGTSRIFKLDLEPSIRNNFKSYISEDMLVKNRTNVIVTVFEQKHVCASLIRFANSFLSGYNVSLVFFEMGTCFYDRYDLSDLNGQPIKVYYIQDRKPARNSYEVATRICDRVTAAIESNFSYEELGSSVKKNNRIPAILSGNLKRYYANRNDRAKRLSVISTALIAKRLVVNTCEKKLEIATERRAEKFECVVCYETICPNTSLVIPLCCTSTVCKRCFTINRKYRSSCGYCGTVDTRELVVNPFSKQLRHPINYELYQIRKLLSVFNKSGDYNKRMTILLMNTSPSMKLLNKMAKCINGKTTTIVFNPQESFMSQLGRALVCNFKNIIFVFTTSTFIVETEHSIKESIYCFPLVNVFSEINSIIIWDNVSWFVFNYIFHLCGLDHMKFKIRLSAAARKGFARGLRNFVYPFDNANIRTNIESVIEKCLAKRYVK